MPTDTTTLQWIVIVVAQLPELVVIGALMAVVLAILRIVTP